VKYNGARYEILETCGPAVGGGQETRAQQWSIVAIKLKPSG